MGKSNNYWGRQFSRRGVLRAGALGGGALALASACGDGEGESGKASPTGAAQQTPKRGGRVRVRQGADPPSWSMLQASGPTAAFADAVYAKLINYKTGPDVKPNDVILEPDMAEAMPEQPDNLTFIFTLRPNLKFQNVAPVNGRPLTIEDVRLAIETYHGKGSPWAGDWAPIDSMEVTGERTIRIKTKEPYAPFLNNAASHYGFRIFPKELLEGDRMKQDAVGSGPWIRESYQQGNRAVYKRNPDYHRQGLPYLDEVQFIVIPNDASAIAAFQTGDIDMLGGVNCVSADQIARAVPDAKRENAFGGGLVAGNGALIASDTTKPPFSDIRVRRALSLALNRDAESKALFCGLAEPEQLMIRGSVARALPVEKLGDAAQYYKYDPNRAKQLLAEAGYPNGFETVANAPDNHGQVRLSALERAIGDWDKVGIKVKPNIVSYTQWIGEMYRPPFKYNGIMYNAQAFYPDPEPYMWYFLHPDGISNTPKVRDETITKLLLDQRREMNPDKRWAILEQLQIRAAEGMYHIGGTTGLGVNFWRPWLQGYGSTRGYDSNLWSLMRAWDGRL